MLFEVSDQSHVAFVRRQAATLAQERGLDEDAAGRLALIATEIGTNLLKHGRGGHISLGTFDDGSGNGVELIALDAGDGIADIPRAIADGFSTAGTSGNGLGIIQRQSNTMTLFSRPGKGTVLAARVGCSVEGAAGKPIVGAINDPCPGEKVSGDAWAFHGGANPMLMVVDGTGHGLAAEQAAQTALQIFRANQNEPCVRIIDLIHRALFSTRGAAVAVARIDTQAKMVRYVGVGNITGGMLAGGEVKRMVSHNGTAGMLSPRFQEFTYPYTGTPTVVMHSDGMSAKWNPDDYPGFPSAHPSVIAGLLFRDFRRGRDDATVAVMRAIELGNAAP